jgi:S1-C subfamily serine protease
LALAGVTSRNGELEGVPVLDQHGRLVGLCSYDRGTTRLIPVADAVSVIDNRRLVPWVGIAATTSVEEGEAFTLITEVAQAGPAAQAGIRVGDVITGFGSQPIDTVVRLGQVLNGFHPGDTVVVTLRRGDVLVEVNVTLVPRPFSL